MDGFAVLGENEEVIVGVVAIVERNIVVFRFWQPKF
jgi:hypothetical protein